MNEIHKTSTLIVHPLGVICDIIRFLLESEFNMDVTSCKTKQEANSLLGKNKYDIIIVATKVPDAIGFDFFKELIDQNKLMPFILVENSHESKLDPYKNAEVKAFIREENLMEGLSEIFSEMLAIDTKNKPEEWTKISLPPLTRFESLPEDVFLELKTGRRIKLFREGDRISIEDVERYTHKGVRNLFLQRKAFLWLLKQIDAVVPAINQNPEGLLKVESSKDQTVDDEECPTFTGPFVLQEKMINELHEKSKDVLIQMKKNKELAKLLKSLNVDRAENAFFRNRIDMICNISCAISKELAWSSDAMYEKLIYIAHVHDLPLIAHPHLAKFQTVFQLELMTDISAEDKKLFIQHPKMAADIVARDSRAPAEAALIVAQHHERPSGKGFPEGLQTARIMPLAALVQISIDFAQYVLENPYWSYDKYAAQTGAQFRGGAFTKIAKALETICKGKI